MEIKLTAEVYRLGISLGLLPKEEVIKWADKVIEQMDDPPYEIIEVSLSSKKKLEDIVFILMDVKGEFDNELPPKIILGLLKETLNMTQDMSNVINILDMLIEHLPHSCEWIETEIHYLSDGYYLAEQSIGEHKDILNDLRRFLNQFVDYTKYLSLIN
ncbi:hypothetical protein WAK64_08410 [Bacillus spongiae]|uniref:Antitoxin n=1 Tax=Bacillus spongiae TaxID=2683610 RepID=A0ABU8HD11_9BACI